MIGAGPQSITDFQGFAALRADARRGENKDANLDAVAKQFESLFIGMMLKQMRQASESMEGGLMDSKQSRQYRDMYDQQIALHMAGQGGLGLAPAIRRQLSGELQVPEHSRSQADYQARPTMRARSIDAVQAAQDGAGSDARADFIRRLRPHAEAAAQRIGIAPEALIAQAALETGWGRSVMQSADGRSSHNLFGIKADHRWSGERVSVETREYREGVPMQVRAEFRAYDSFADSFADYAEFVSSQPRYRQAMQSAADPRAYFEALQQAGYATDPAYADKVMRILERGGLQVAKAGTATSHGQG